MTDLSPIHKITRSKQQQLILERFSYHSCGPEEREQIETRARHAVTVSSKPIFIFREIMNYLTEQRIVVPGYSFIQETVGQAITFEQNRLTAMMRNHLKHPDIQALQALLEDTQGLYEITRLKREPKDFSLKEIKREIDRGKQVQSLYQLAQTLLPKLGISNESIKYFASLVNYYSVYKLKRLDEWMVYVYLLCFVYYRYQRMNDNLINTLIYNVRRYIDEAKSTAKDQLYQRHAENRQNMKRAGEVLQLLTDNSIEADTPFVDVQAKAFSILERQKLASLANQIAANAKWDETALQWEHFDQLAGQFKRHLRPLLLMVNFAAPSRNDPLMEAINFMKRAFHQNKPLGQYALESLPQRFISDNLKRYIYKQESGGEKTIWVDRYEFLIYRLLRNRLEAGDAFCGESIRFRSFEDDLIDDGQWQQKDKLLADANLTTFYQPIHEHLAELEQKLESRLREVNQHIASGENEHVHKKRGSHGRWTLSNTRDTESVNHAFFNALRPIDIGSVLHYVNQHCSFIEAFDHILGRYAKQSKEDYVLVACLIAWGTNMGLGRMGEISDIRYPSLAATSDNFVRLETLKEANDRISDAITKLPIFHHYDMDDTVHSSSDGQKFETQINTIHSRHSPKYFGLKKGIVSYTMVANHVPVNARIIGANEHESHYVFDILYNNTTEIQPEVHSTDTHGTNEVNFSILHFFGYQFAPRYKDIYGRHDLSIVTEHTAPVRHTLAEQHLREKNQSSWKEDIREAIESAREVSTDFDSFKSHLKEDYEIEAKLRGETLSFKHPDQKRFIRANKLGFQYELEGLNHGFTRQAEREQEHERVVPRNEETERTDGQLYQSSHEREHGEGLDDSKGIRRNSTEIERSDGKYGIDFEQARADVNQKHRNFTSNFDRWTRADSKEQQQDDSSPTRNSRDKQQSAAQHEQRDNVEHQQDGERTRKNRDKSKSRDDGLSL